MTQFVHLADSRIINRIAKAGIGVAKTKLPKICGFYCTPVCKDYYRTHQWLRELKRTGVKSIHAIQFSVHPDLLVWIGRYNSEHIQVTAAEAVGIFEKHESGLGLEVIISERIDKAAITKIYALSQAIGWRFYPEAKGSKPFCGCKYCNRGSINAYRVITEGKG